MPGGTNFPALGGLGCGSQTPYPYDAYPPGRLWTRARGPVRASSPGGSNPAGTATIRWLWSPSVPGYEIFGLASEPFWILRLKWEDFR